MKKILLVDNSAFILNILSSFFSNKSQFKIYPAKDIKELENLLKKEKFFVAVSSIMLPNASNGEAIRILKEYSIPTIILSSVIDEYVVDSADKYCVVDYVSKSSIHQLEYVCELIELLVFMEGIEVLVVEDSTISAELIKDLLETLLLKVHIVKSAEKALNILKNNKNISLLISDHYMENLNGLDFIKKIREEKYNYSKIPVIMITTGVDNKLKIDFFKNGVVDFLVKPILNEELKAKIINIFLNQKHIAGIKKFNKMINKNIITATINNLGIITYVSKSFCDISGYDKDELIGENCEFLFKQDEDKISYKNIISTLKKTKIWKGEIKHIRKDSSIYWVDATVEADFDSNGRIISYTLIEQDITDKKQIYTLSITDHLTSLYNKRYFTEISDTLLDNKIRNNENFVFLLLDIDNFKNYNDIYGHQEGDKVLTIIANSLKSSLKRVSDMIFRLGGEEFGAIFSTQKREDAIEISEQIRQKIEDLDIKHEGNKPYLKLTVSIGINIVENYNDFKDLSSIYKLADLRLYKAKSLGRNKLVSDGGELSFK